jgi:hypothetical protein
MNSFPSCECYSNFRETLVPKILSFREPADFYDPIPISEKLVQAIWEEQLFDKKALRTRCGKEIQILFPGQWNVEGGPDFQGAHIMIDGKEVHGDIEIHLDSRGWHEHQHRLNPRYNQVILDVALWDGGESSNPSTSAKKAVPQLFLQSYLQCSLSELAESLDPDRYPFSPTKTRFPFSLPVPKQEWKNYIESAGMFRFEQKTKRFRQNIRETDESQALYEGIAEALGYKHNKIAFRNIAKSIPLEKLSKLSLDEKIRLLLETSKKHSIRISQVRPANHPERRLAALAILIDSQPNLPKFIQDLITSSKELVSPPHLEHLFWSHHYHSRSSKLKKPLALIGKNRWLEIVTNVILPFSSALANENKRHESIELPKLLFTKLPTSQSNLSARHIAFELGLPSPKKTIEQQGLLQIYQDFDLFFTPEIAKASSL